MVGPLALVRLARTLHQINRENIDPIVQKKIRRTYLSGIILERYDSQNNTADVAGYKCQFCTYAGFSYLFNELFLNQAYLFSTSKDNPFIIDCGSNIGMSVLYFKMMYPDAEILAFEPDDDAFRCLQVNVDNNNFKSVSVIKKALSTREGKLDFYYDPDNPGALKMSTIRERMPKEKRVVEATRLSNYVNDEVDFLKLDVEGAEVGVIEDLNTHGKLPHIKQMAIEYHHHIFRDTDTLSNILGLLETAGFGYQIESSLGRPFNRETFQDILIYAYRKAINT